MKRLTEQNYYNLLDLSPLASLEEVRAAYHAAMDMYADDSVVTYSLFTQEEREHLNARLIDAYKTLSNSKSRKDYDRLLLEKGELSHNEVGASSSENPDSTEGKLREVTVESLTKEDKKPETRKQSVEGTLEFSGNLTSVTGKGIRMIRMAATLTLEEIYRKTNVPKRALENIEEERFESLPDLVYLKGFLRAFAQTLNADADQMVDGYVQRFLEWKHTCQK